MFQEKEWISASLVDSFNQLPLLDHNESWDMFTLDLPVGSSTEYKEEDKISVEGDLTAQQINDWLAYADWSKEYKQNLVEWKKEYNIGSNRHGYSPKALQAWMEWVEECSSKLPLYKQKQRWIYKKVGKQNEDFELKPLLPKILDIPKASALQQQNRDTRWGIKIKKPEKVERRLGPNLPGKAISLVSTAAMDAIIRGGTPAYFLHINAVLPESDESNSTNKGNCNSPEAMRGNVDDSTLKDGQSEMDEKSCKEEEELLKYIPEKYRDYLDVFSPGEAK